MNLSGNTLYDLTFDILKPHQTPRAVERHFFDAILNFQKWSFFKEICPHRLTLHVFFWEISWE